MGADLKLLGAGAVKLGVSEVVRAFERQTGYGVAMEFTSAPKVRERVLGGEAVDVVVASGPVLDALARAGRIDAASRVVLGRSRMAVVMRSGTPAPELSSVEALRRALEGADAIVYNEGSSGAHAAAVVDKIGLRAEMGARIRVVRNGGELMDAVASGNGRVLALAQETSVAEHARKGAPVALAGLLPEALQNVTLYEAAVAAGGAVEAAALARAFDTAESRKRLAASGLG